MPCPAFIIPAAAPSAISCIKPSDSVSGSTVRSCVIRVRFFLRGGSGSNSDLKFSSTEARASSSDIYSGTPNRLPLYSKTLYPSCNLAIVSSDQSVEIKLDSLEDYDHLK